MVFNGISQRQWVLKNFKKQCKEVFFVVLVLLAVAYEVMDKKTALTFVV